MSKQILKNFEIKCLNCNKLSEIKLSVYEDGILIECEDCGNNIFVKEKKQ